MERVTDLQRDGIEDGEREVERANGKMMRRMEKQWTTVSM